MASPVTAPRANIGHAAGITTITVTAASRSAPATYKRAPAAWPGLLSRGFGRLVAPPMPVAVPIGIAAAVIAIVGSAMRRHPAAAPPAPMPGHRMHPGAAAAPHLDDVRGLPGVEVRSERSGVRRDRADGERTDERQGCQTHLIPPSQSVRTTIGGRRGFRAHPQRLAR